MKKEKDLRLVNIYIKIHNKKNLTMDDLAYLAKYNPECFKKTCDNLIYKMPETKPLVTPPEQEAAPKAVPATAPETMGNPFELSPEEKRQNENMLLRFFENMRKLESNDVNFLQNIDVSRVKQLVGNLFMEHLFPHSNLEEYFDVSLREPESTFNVKV